MGGTTNSDAETVRPGEGRRVEVDESKWLQQFRTGGLPSRLGESLAPLTAVERLSYFAM